MVKKNCVLFIAAILMIALPSAAAAQKKSKKQAKPVVDAEAMRLLKSMSDFLAGMDKFTYSVVNMREDLTRSGHRVDYEVAAKVTVDRPNKLKAVRQGHLIDQEIYYNGKSLVIFSPSSKIYSSVDVPDTIDSTLKFARERLGVGYPAADLMYSDTFPLLTKGVISATVIGKEMIAGHPCDHLLFTLPGVDFQIWISDHGDPLPFKYIVTDTGTRQLLSIVAILDSWNLSPNIDDNVFDFVPPNGARVMPFRTVEGKTLAPRTN